MAKVQYTVRIEESLFDRVKAASVKDMRSLNNQIEYLLFKGLERTEREAALVEQFMEEFEKNS